MINFRPITKNDFADLCSVLQDKNVMYAWEHAFSDEEVHKWIENCQKSYAENGFGYLYATESETGKFIGMMGLLLETVNGQNYIGLGYIRAPKYWKKGYATQGAAILLNRAFRELGAQLVIAEIRPENTASRRVAERLGMKCTGEFLKYYRGKQMPHLIYRITKNEFCTLKTAAE